MSETRPRCAQAGRPEREKVFPGTEALDLQDGLADTTLEIAQVERAMIKAAKQVVLLADSAKWNHTGFIKVAQLAEVDVLISDDKLPKNASAAIEQLGIQLLVVETPERNFRRAQR